jgi:hypothetical protein
VLRASPAAVDPVVRAEPPGLAEPDPDPEDGCGRRLRCISESERERGGRDQY